jgi:hypothetical protein
VAESVGKFVTGHFGRRGGLPKPPQAAAAENFLGKPLAEPAVGNRIAESHENVPEKPPMTRAVMDKDTRAPRKFTTHDAGRPMHARRHSRSSRRLRNSAGS